MTMIAKIYLISETISQDDIGQPIATETKSDPIIVEKRSVSQSEFMEGKQNGFSPEYVFDISIFAYSGESIIEYNGMRYSVYRSNGYDENTIALYCEREVGTSSAPDQEDDNDG